MSFGHLAVRAASPRHASRRVTPREVTGRGLWGPSIKDVWNSGVGKVDLAVLITYCEGRPQS